jgi:hypothetical protein
VRNAADLDHDHPNDRTIHDELARAYQRQEHTND